ncbi:hypothetical protein KAW50_02615 [candidate division WOR-3 bacterium]|nr:hypothetical protein [candidate division WOR-3 bacterium]
MLLGILLILIIVLVFIGIVWTLEKETLQDRRIPFNVPTINDCFLKVRIPLPEENPDLILITSNSYRAVYPSETRSFRTYGARIDILLEEISSRESGGDPKICNLEFGCGSGAGLTGIIPSTQKDCEEALGRKLDIFNKEDNLACAKWLLETRGIWPWEPWSGSYYKILTSLDLLDLY